MKHFFSLLLLLCFSTLHAQQPWSLRQCIEHALSHNIAVQQKTKTVENNKIELSTARNSRLPDLHASANQSFNFGRGLTSDNTYANRNTRSTSFDIGSSIPLYTGGQISNTIAAQRINLQAAMADLQKAREDISLQVASAYLEVLYQKEILTAAQHQVELSQEQLRRAESLYQNGKTSPAEVAEAQSTLANDELSLTQHQNTLQLTLLDLSQLLELPSPDGFDIENPTNSNEIPITIDGTPTDSSSVLLNIEQRPAIQAEQLRLQSAQKSIRIAQSGYYPTVSLSAGLGSSYYKTSGFDADNFGDQLSNNFNRYIGLSLSVPIFNRYTTRNQVRQARLQAENQQLVLDNARKTAYKEVQQAYYNASTAQKQYTASIIAEEAAHTAFNLMQKKFDNGKANHTQYQEARTRHLKAITTLLQAKYTFLFRQKILNFYRGEPLYCHDNGYFCKEKANIGRV